jgi:predicted amidohydrolase YtcJ
LIRSLVRPARWAPLLVLVAALSACNTQHPTASERPSTERGLLLTNGEIFTGEADASFAEAIVIRDGQVEFVGATSEALSRRRAGDRLHDLGGKLVLPGFVDGHTHPGMIAFLGEDSSDSPIPKGSHEEILEWLGDYAGWFWPPFIQAGSWPVALYGEAGPRKEELDRVVGVRPVILFDDSGHSQWLNSSALSLMGIDASTPDPAPGLSRFARDENGEPTGWALEFALVPFIGETLLPGQDEMRERLESFLQFLSRYGVTTLFDAGNLIFHDQIYSIVSELEAEGRLPIRYFGTVHITFPDQLDTAVAELKRLRKEYGGERLRFETIKIHFDGVAEIRSAATLEPYLGERGENGATLVGTTRLRDFILELHEEDIDLHLHTSGDRAVRVALDAVEQAREETGSELRCQVSLAHIEMISEEDVPRFAELGVVANFTPHWYGGYFKGSELTIGDRSKRLHRVRTVAESDAVVSFSSDVTGSSESHRANPFFGIQTGHNRQDAGEGPSAAVMPPVEEKVGLETLVRGYTIGSALQLDIDDEVGSLTVGKRADLIVLDRNLFEVGRYDIASIEPLAVFLGGDLVQGGLSD